MVFTDRANHASGTPARRTAGNAWQAKAWTKRQVTSMLLNGNLDILPGCASLLLSSGPKLHVCVGGRGCFLSDEEDAGTAGLRLRFRLPGLESINLNLRLLCPSCPDFVLKSPYLSGTHTGILTDKDPRFASE